MEKIKLIGIILLVIFGLWYGMRHLIIRASPPPANLGVQDGRFAPCPGSPNCVSSQEERDAFYTKPISFTGEAGTARSQLIELVNGMPRMQMESVDGNYLHATARSPMMGFIDDIQFWVDEESGQIEIRSAARLGHGDFGANAGYASAIRRAFREASGE